MMLEMDFVKNYVNGRYETEMSFCDLGGLVNEAKEEFSLFMNLEEIVGFSINYPDMVHLMVDLDHTISELSDIEIMDEVSSLLKEYNKELF